MDTVDVAELTGSRRRAPRWLRLVAICALCGVPGWLLIARLTAPAVTAEGLPPGFPDHHTIELGVAITSRTDDTLWITSHPNPLAGLDFRGVRTDSGKLIDNDRPLVLAAHGRTTVTLTWHVADCRAARAAASHDVRIPVRAGRMVGGPDTTTLDAGSFGELMPSVCELQPEGMPRLIAQDVVPGPTAVEVELVVANVGGRSMILRRLERPPGWDNQADPPAQVGQRMTLPAGSERAGHPCEVPSQ